MKYFFDIWPLQDIWLIYFCAFSFIAYSIFGIIGINGFYKLLGLFVDIFISRNNFMNFLAVFAFFTTTEAIKLFYLFYQLLKKLLDRTIPAIPKINYPLVDVRDVALAHVKAMILPAAKGQFTCAYVIIVVRIYHQINVHEPYAFFIFGFPLTIVHA